MSSKIIVYENHLDPAAGELNVSLCIPFITWPANGDSLDDHAIDSLVGSLAHSWALAMTDRLSREPFHMEAWRACTALTIQRASLLAWRAKQSHQWKQARFYEAAREAMGNALGDSEETHRRLLVRFEAGELDLSVWDMLIVGVHAEKGDALSVAGMASVSVGREGKGLDEEVG
ncbi:hypothetical protein G7046_g1024 [Stylonectria norvegica]|nr:hypothetical protein G7046_g1024 [Stylonectria norvegica]